MKNQLSRFDRFINEHIDNKTLKVRTQYKLDHRLKLIKRQLIQKDDSDIFKGYYNSSV